MRLALAPAIALVAVTGCSRPAGEPAAPLPVLEAQTSGTTALLQAISPVSEQVVWASGHRGTWVRTTDGGRSWRSGRVPGADTLQFRDVHAVDADRAYLLSAGTGALSRIYKTTDGGATWTLQHVNAEPEGFYDCLAFWGEDRGVAYGDQVGGRLTVLLTEDGGRTWAQVPAERLPAALPNEGGFAASGGCVATGSGGRGWIATGNTSAARVLRTTDGGRSWTAAVTPLVTGEGAGATAVLFRDDDHGAVVGGDIGTRDRRSDNVAVTGDGGRTWSLAGRTRIAGAAYGGAYVPGMPRPTLVVVGPGGADLSQDEGATWAALDTLAYWSAAFASPRAGWLVGPSGRITHVRLR